MLPVIHRHVPQRIHRNQTADDAGNENHDNGQIVDIEIPHRPGIAACMKLKGHDQEKLGKSQQGGEIALVFHTEIKNRQCSQAVHSHHQKPHQRRIHTDFERMSEIHDPYSHRKDPHQKRRHTDQRIPHRWIPVHQKNQCRHQRQRKKQCR